MSSSEEEELEIGSSDSEDAVVQDPDDFEALPKSKLRAQQPLDVTYDPAYQGTACSVATFFLFIEAKAS